MPRNSEHTLTQHQRIAELAKQRLEMAFTSLNHLLDLRALWNAFRKTPIKKAPGAHPAKRRKRSAAG